MELHEITCVVKPFCSEWAAYLRWRPGKGLVCLSVCNSSFLEWSWHFWCLCTLASSAHFGKSEWNSLPFNWNERIPCFWHSQGSVQELECLLTGLGTLRSSACLNPSPSVKQEEIMSTVSGLLVSLRRLSTVSKTPQYLLLCMPFPCLPVPRTSRTNLKGHCVPGHFPGFPQESNPVDSLESCLIC